MLTKKAFILAKILFLQNMFFHFPIFSLVISYEIECRLMAEQGHHKVDS